MPRVQLPDREGEDHSHPVCGSTIADDYVYDDEDDDRLEWGGESHKSIEVKYPNPGWCLYLQYFKGIVGTLPWHTGKLIAFQVGSLANTTLYSIEGQEREEHAQGEEPRHYRYFVYKWDKWPIGPLKQVTPEQITCEPYNLVVVAVTSTVHNCQ